MSEQKSATEIKCLHPEAVGTRWGDPISEQRQAELQGYLDRWEAETDHGERKGPFDSFGKLTVRLTGADITWLAEQANTHDMSRLLEQAKASGTSAAPFDFPGPRLERADLTGAHLEGVFLSAVHLEEANLSEAHLEGGNLGGAHLEGAYLAEAHLEGTFLAAAYLEGAYLAAAHLEGADLTLVHLEHAHLPRAHLEYTYLLEAHLETLYVNTCEWSRK
jgi:uncharacterized protein YjbI with pentapeptide repeats